MDVPTMRAIGLTTTRTHLVYLHSAPVAAATSGARRVNAVTATDVTTAPVDAAKAMAAGPVTAQPADGDAIWRAGSAVDIRQRLAAAACPPL